MPGLLVACAAEIREGERRIVNVGRSSIGVIRAQVRLHVYLNHCPHQGGPVRKGLLIDRVEEDGSRSSSERATHISTIPCSAL
jgi:nitrite reductase (NADH) small subunit